MLFLKRRINTETATQIATIPTMIGTPFGSAARTIWPPTSPPRDSPGRTANETTITKIKTAVRITAIIAISLPKPGMGCP